jgi:cytochrome c
LSFVVALEVFLMLRPSSFLLSSLGLGLFAAVAQAQPPFTADQAASGKKQYTALCESCHGDNLDGGVGGGPPLQGDYFFGNWGDMPISALAEYIKVAMPADTPGSLGSNAVAQIVAYMLEYNGFQPGDTPLPSAASDLESHILTRP